MTPEELFAKYFTEEELNIIKSNPDYFMLDKDLFGESEFLQQRRLIDTIEDEEKMKQKIKDKKKYV
jgi:hypothetical protein